MDASRARRFSTAWSAALLLALVATSSPAPADEGETLGLAREMLLAMRTSDNFDAILPTLMGALKPALTGNDPKAARDYDEIAPLMTREFAATKDEMIAEMAQIYATSFTADELRQYVAFYKTPAGAKLARETPALASQAMAVGQRFGQQVAAHVAERMREELRKRGNKI